MTDVRTDVLVIGGGQAGLATSHWLGRAGVDHLVVDRRDRLGGGWHDRWDEFCLVLPNLTVQLPGMPYDGDDPDGFMSRDDMVKFMSRFAAGVDPPVRLGTTVTRLAAGDGELVAHTGGGTIRAGNVVLATGPHPRPSIPSAAAGLSADVRQLHSDDYRNPGELPAGGVLVVGSGQSGAQIAEELNRAGREVHLAVSTCFSAPRRYRGHDHGWWIFQVYLHGGEVGVSPKPQTPADRFAPNPILSGQRGGHGIDLRELAADGVRLYGRLESADGTTVRFRDDLAERLVFAETRFDLMQRRMIDAYIAAAGIDAPPDDRPERGERPDPPTSTGLDLAAAGITSVIWATGYRLDFGWVDLPIFDEWDYPEQDRGVTAHPGLYAVGLPWLHSMASSVSAGVGPDAEYVVNHIVDRLARQNRA